jgi:hypothetical protein
MKFQFLVWLVVSNWCDHLDWNCGPQDTNPWKYIFRAGMQLLGLFDEVYYYIFVSYAENMHTLI